MQNIIIDKPYEFVPPYYGRFWSALLQLYLPRYLDRRHGLVEISYRGKQHLVDSLAAGHAILLTPNHCRPCDPFVLGLLAKEVHTHFFAMASWHLFTQGLLQRWMIRRAGAFSVYREGMDRAAINAAIEILEKAVRPLVIFPEGVISRSNDRLNSLMEGTALIARTAARKRAKALPEAKVVVHPVAIKYLFAGDIESTVTRVLDEIEARLSWQPQRHLDLVDRIYKVGEALLCLKEIEYLGQPQSGDIVPRLAVLIDHILVPHEQRWLEGRSDGSVVARVKRLRAAILPDMRDGDITDEQREQRWRDLADLYLGQQLFHYPPNYVRSRPTPERMLETVERFEEDLTDQARTHRPMRAVLQVGAAIDVGFSRDRKDGDRESSELMQNIEEQLTAMLSELTDESTNGDAKV